jgi:hypothetical protein
LIGWVEGDLLHHVALVPPCHTPIELMERLSGSSQLQLHAFGDRFIAITENGLLVLDGSGRECWRLDRVTYDWDWVGLVQGQIWLSDAHGNLLGFDPATGQEAD